MRIVSSDLEEIGLAKVKAREGERGEVHGAEIDVDEACGRAVVSVDLVDVYGGVACLEAVYEQVPVESYVDRGGDRGDDCSEVVGCLGWGGGCLERGSNVTHDAISLCVQGLDFSINVLSVLIA